MKTAKGPWCIGSTVGLLDVVLSAEGAVIAKVLTKGTVSNYYHAQLLAAAPSLRDALEELLASLQDLDTSNNNFALTQKLGTAELTAARLLKDLE